MCDYCSWLAADHWPLGDDVLWLAFVAFAASADGTADAEPPMIQHSLEPAGPCSCDSVSGL